MNINYQEIEKRLNILGENLRQKVSSKDFQNYKDFIDSGEAGIALETLCTQIVEYSVEIDKLIFQEIKELCLYFKVDKSYFENIVKDHLIRD